VDFNLHIPGHAMIFAFIFGILASPRASRRDNPFALEIPFRLALPALGVWMAISGLTKFAGEYWCEKARVALRDGRFANSVQLGERALANEKRNYDVYLRLGEAHRNLALQSRDLPERKAMNESAVAAFEAGLRIFPYDHSGLVRKAQTLDSLGRYVEAREAYQKAIQNDPNLGVLYGYFCPAPLQRLEEWKKAVKRCKSAAPDVDWTSGKIIDPAFIDAPIEPPTPQGLDRNKVKAMEFLPKTAPRTNSLP
jgi:tetratricopeptide (TPR) repeat protein